LGQRDGERLITILDGAFRAALAGADDAVASDLAFSLAQDVSVSDDLRRDGGSLRLAGADAPITHLGHDYVQAGCMFVPLDRAVVTLGGHPAPTGQAQVFLGRLRALAREASCVTVGLRDARSVAGRVVKATPAHLVVRNSQMWAVPLAEIEFVRLSRGGSGDRSHD